MALRMRTKTVQLADGKRVNWFDVSYTLVTKIQDGYEFTIYWKYKAAIKSETLSTTMADNEVNKYFSKFGLVKWDQYYINLDKVMLINEETIHGAIEKSSVEMVFVDGLYLKRKVPAQEWSWWKQLYV
jgi:hypothetical protein